MISVKFHSLIPLYHSVRKFYCINLNYQIQDTTLNSLSFVKNDIYIQSYVTNVLWNSLGNNKTNLANKESNFWTTNKQLKRKLCWDICKSKGNFYSQDLLSPIFMNHEINNKTVSPDLVCSTSAPLDFLPGKLLNWL